MKPELASWQELVATYDRKAHRKNGWISISFTGSFRAINDARVARRLVEYMVTPKVGHADVIQEVIDFLISIRDEAQDLDERIELRRNQQPHERQYLYDD